MPDAAVLDRPVKPRRFGSALPRIFTPPLVEGPPTGPVTPRYDDGDLAFPDDPEYTVECPCGCALDNRTSLGFNAVAFGEKVLGVRLMPWQRFLLIHALELLEGHFRFRTLILLVARQNGKSTVMQILSLYRMYVDGVGLVIGTAQNLDIAEEVWAGALEIVEENEDLKEDLGKVDRTNGKKSFRLDFGPRYKVQTATRRGGRGLSGDLILLDELREHQTWDAWGAITKTTMAREDAQIWCASNAGDIASVVLRFLRKTAHEALGDPDGIVKAYDELRADAEVDTVDDLLADPELEDEILEDEDSLGIFEWSAPPGARISDRAAWAFANPALGWTITERAIGSAARTDPEWVFRTEVLCQWSDGALEGIFPPGAWVGSEDRESEIEAGSPLGLCVDVAWDRSASHISVAGWRADGLPHVEVIASRAGTDWVIPWLTSLERPDDVRKAEVAVQAAGAPASALVEDMVAAGVTVKEWKGQDLGKACGAFYDRVRAAVGQGTAEAGLRHRGQPVLNLASAAAVTKPMGDSWLIDRRKSPLDAAPLISAVGALWNLAAPPDPKKKHPKVHEFDPDEIAGWLEEDTDGDDTDESDREDDDTDEKGTS